MLKKDCNLIPIKSLKQHWKKSGFSYMEKPRPDYGIMLLLNGRIDFVSHLEILCAKAGDIIFLPKNSYYEARVRVEFGEVDDYLINFESDRDFNCIKPMLVSENTSFSCADLFRQFIEENYNIESMNFRSKGLFYLLWDLILNENKTKKPASDKVFEKAKILLDKDDDIPISKIARECSVSESGLRKIFNDQIGISPTQYRLKEKLNKAKYLLESTDMSIGEISDKLNFYDAAYFCRMFSKYTGVTPKKYSKQRII